MKHTDGYKLYSFWAYGKYIKVYALRKSEARMRARYLYGNKYERY